MFKFHLLLDFDLECSQNNFDEDKKLIWAENVRKNDIVGKLRLGPKSVKRHGI